MRKALERFSGNEARNAAIEQLRRFGYSAGKIAQTLSITRNTVAGVLNRRGLKGMETRESLPQGSSWPRKDGSMRSNPYR